MFLGVEATPSLVSVFLVGFEFVCESHYLKGANVIIVYILILTYCGKLID